MFNGVVSSLHSRGVDWVMARSADTILWASRDLDSWLRARRTRAWSSHFSMIAFVGMLHVFTLDVFILNLVILNSVLHELIQLVEGLPLLVVWLRPLLDLVVVGVHTRVVLIYHLERVLRLLLLLVLGTTRWKVFLGVVVRHLSVVVVLPTRVSNLLFLLQLLELGLVLFQVDILIWSVVYWADLRVCWLLSSVVEGILVWLARFLIGKVLRNLVVEILLHPEFFLCHHSFFSCSIGVNIVMIWSVFIITHNRVMINTLELLILLISFDLNLTSRWNIFISECFLDLLAL